MFTRSHTLREMNVNMNTPPPTSAFRTALKHSYFFTLLA